MRNSSSMSRRTAWATAFAIGLTLLAAVVATATNVGILGFGGPARVVGQASAADPLPAPTTTGSVVVRYQDVYVTDPAAATPAAPATSPADEPSITAPSRDGEHESDEHESDEHKNEHENEHRDGQDDDD